MSESEPPEVAQDSVDPIKPVVGKPDYYQKLHKQLQAQLRQAVDSLQLSVGDVDFLGDAVASPAPQDLKAHLDPQARKDQEEKLAAQVQQAQQALEAHRVQTDQLEILALLGQLDQKALKEIKDRLVRLVRNKSR